MTRTIEEMCKARDPLYAAMQPVGVFSFAVTADEWAEMSRVERNGKGRLSNLDARDAYLLSLTIRALRNQGEPYYRVR